jgi:hypothetical protein
MKTRIEGWLFDIDELGPAVALWVYDAGVPIHPGEIVGYVIADAKAKDKSRRVMIGGDQDELRYDVKEYVKRLRDAGKEVRQF